MKIFSNFILGAVLYVFLWSCMGSSDSIITSSAEDGDSEFPIGVSPWKDPKSFVSLNPNPYNDNPYKLNVIYFVPNDLDTIPDYRKRISKIMLFAQNMFGIGRKYYGFGGNSSFSMEMMPNSSEYVKIITLRGKNPKSYYPATGEGGNRMNDEVKQYFAQNPGEKKSDHNFIITPSYYSDDIGGPPFHGGTKLAFGLDYPGQDISQLGEVDHATLWIGGLIHELGHGLNAPHNKELKREAEFLGTAMMRAGNGTLGKSPTYITKSTSGLLSASQVFSKEVRNDWYEDFDFELKQLKGKLVGNNIVISGKYTSSKPIKVVNVLHDPDGSEDYDSVGFISTLDDNGNFTANCPLKDFHVLQGNYQLRLEFYAVNGVRKIYNTDYSFDKGIPRIESINTRDLIGSTDWKVIEVSSDNGSSANNLVDGKAFTIWHTRWSTGPYDPFPHHFIVDMAKQTDISGFAFYNRDDTNGAMKDIEIFKSNNGSWVSIGTFNLQKQKYWRYIDLPEKHNMRYVKVVIKSAYIPDPGHPYTHLGEFGAF